MDGQTGCTGCKRSDEEMKILSANFESIVARVQNMEQKFLKAIQDLHTGLKHFITNRCYESSSSNSEDIGSDQRKRKRLRLKRRPQSGYRCKKTIVSSSRRKGKKQIMKTDDDATGIVNDAAECENLGTDRSWLLAEAIQEHSVSLVRQLPFDESELSDMLIPDCLTEDENETIRKLPDRKSKIRSLLCLLAGRDYVVLKQFLAHAKRFNEALVEAVWKTFEEKVNRRYIYRPICILCSIKKNVEVSYVIDHLYSRHVVTKKLLQKTACSSSQANESLWDELYEICLNHYDKLAAFAFLAEALEAKGYYQHLSEKLKKSKAIDQLCMCPKLPPVHLEAPMGNSSTPDSSDSPYSSIQSTSSFGEDTSNEETMDPRVSTTTNENLQETIINGCISNIESVVTSDNESPKRSDSKQEELIVQSFDDTRITVIEPINPTSYNHTDNVHGGCHNAQRKLVAENPERECLLKDAAGQGSLSCNIKSSEEHSFEFSADASKGNREKEEMMGMSRNRKRLTILNQLKNTMYICEGTSLKTKDADNNFHLIRSGNVIKSCKNTDSENVSSATNSQTITWKTNTHSTILKDAHLGEATKRQDDKSSRSRKTTKKETNHQLTDEATQTLSDLCSQNQTVFNNNFDLCLQVFIAFILATFLFII